MKDAMQKIWQSFIRYTEAMDGSTYPLDRIRALDQEVAALKAATKVSASQSANEGKQHERQVPEVTEA